DLATGKPVIDPDTGQPVMVPDVVAKQSLDLTSLKQGGPLHQPPKLPPGVIGATLQGNLPGGPIALASSPSPHIDGLSPRTRTLLKSKTVAETRMSLVAQGTFHLPGPADPDNEFLLRQPVTIGINEVGAVFNLTDEFGKDWL